MFRFLGNILWFVLVGLVSGLAWAVIGLLWCITFAGIPVGVQCFKMAKLSFFPFGKTVTFGNGTFSFLVNIIWLILFGWELALYYLVLGLIFCVTVIAIPAGLQCFKMAKLALFPFGAVVS